MPRLFVFNHRVFISSGFTTSFYHLKCCWEWSVDEMRGRRREGREKEGFWNIWGRKMNWIEAFPTIISKALEIDLTIHCKRVLQSHNIYHYATETQFSTFENTNFLFLVSITLTQNFWVLSDGNNIRKSSQTQIFFLWVPRNLDDGWRKLSDNSVSM